MPKVLIADDKEENRFVLSNFFKLFGHDVGIEIIETSSAKETVSMVMEHKPSLVLLDIKMETNDAGFLALKEIRDNPLVSKTVIWAITAQNLESETMEGFDDYIMKPFDLIDLLKKTSSILKIAIPDKLKLKMGIT
ncbi:MAG TPA: response regulator [Spirochaetota bacterium]|nr:response regulator [Spirochaetota bacterium]